MKLDETQRPSCRIAPPSVPISPQGSVTSSSSDNQSHSGFSPRQPLPNFPAETSLRGPYARADWRVDVRPRSTTPEILKESYRHPNRQYHFALPIRCRSQVARPGTSRSQLCTTSPGQLSGLLFAPRSLAPRSASTAEKSSQPTRNSKVRGRATEMYENRNAREWAGSVEEGLRRPDSAIRA